MNNESNVDSIAPGPEHNGSSGNKRRNGKARSKRRDQTKDETDKLLREAEAEDLMLYGGPESETTREPASGAGAKGTDSGASRGQAKILLEMFGGLNLIRSPDGRAFAKIIVPSRDEGQEQSTVPTHVEVLGLGSQAFKDWVLDFYYKITKSAPSEQALTGLIQTLKARARYQGRHEEVFIRVGTDGDRNYIDLGDPAWRVVEIAKEGWQVRDQSPIAFRRAAGMLPLPLPIRGGSVALLRQYVNVGSDDDFNLLVAWLVFSLRPVGPYPPLILQGEQGSAKSTTSRILRRLIDPNDTPLRSQPRAERDLMIAARASWLIALDNLSGVAPWFSDALCRLVTGGGFATRALYSDDEEVFFKAMRPILLNGIDDVADRPDLLDRAIQLHLPPIPEDKRREEATFWERFDADLGSIFGVLLDAYAGALRKLPEVRLARMPRMADFARFGEAVGRALDWGEGTFLRAYGSNSERIRDLAADASPVASAIRTLMATSDEWSGTTSELLRELTKLVDEKEARSWSWPQTPRKLSNELVRLAGILRQLGFRVDRSETKTNRGFLLKISKAAAPVPCQRSQPSQQSLGFGPQRFGWADAPSGTRDGTSHKTMTADEQPPNSHNDNLLGGNELGESSDDCDGCEVPFEASQESDDEGDMEWNQ